MRVGAEWIASKEDVVDAGLSWVEIGYNAADIGLTGILASALLIGLALRRDRPIAGSGLAGGSTIIVSVLLIAYLVAVWAMTTKPG
jgi:hypothetical protein